MDSAVMSSTALSASSGLDRLGGLAARYGLVLVIAWIGALKFTGYEAAGIEPLVSHSPLTSWLYGFLSVKGLSAALGVAELVIALLLAVKPWAPRLSIVGSVAAIGLFVTTLSFLITTPGVIEPSAGIAGALSSTGQFLIKDAALLGVAVWTLTDALRTISRPAA